MAMILTQTRGSPPATMGRVAIPPLMIVPLAIAHSTIIKGGYPEVSLRLMLWRKGEMLWRKGKML